jgi:hypothetical protein
MVTVRMEFLVGTGTNSAHNTARVGSAVQLGFCVIIAAVLYSATKVEMVDKNRHCANGHKVSPLAKFCEECGARVVIDKPESGRQTE